MQKSNKQLDDFLNKIIVAVEFDALDESELNEFECKQFQQITNEKKRSYWLKGRKALKNILTQLNISTDTSVVSFPNSYFSITHSGDYAVAVGVKPYEKIEGVGVDLEINRYPKVGSEKYFLTKREIDWLYSLPLHKQESERLRLWTVKEALYKAFPLNNNIRLTSLEIEELVPFDNVLKVLINKYKIECVSLPIYLEPDYEKNILIEKLGLSSSIKFGYLSMALTYINF